MSQFARQPSSHTSMKLENYSIDNDSEQEVDSLSHAGHAHSHNHGSCHIRRRKHMFAATMALGMMLVVLLVLGILDAGAEVADMFGSHSGLLKRQSNTSGQQGVFVKNKLYLIVIIVGFFVVVLLAVMLSFWCCKGSFQNPLCCPCYLCACCGGLACLECIGCGLCAEGVEDIGYNP